MMPGSVGVASAVSYEPVPPLEMQAPRPAEELGDMLLSRLQDAEEQLARGRALLRDWEPVARACHVALEALQQETADGPVDRG